MLEALATYSRPRDVAGADWGLAEFLYGVIPLLVVDDRPVVRHGHAGLIESARGLEGNK